MEAVAYSVKKDMARYLLMSQNGVDGLHEQDFLSYEVETYAPVHVGEQVKFRGQTLYVSRADAALEKGIFVYRLTLTTKNGMCRRYQQNDRLAGCSLRAKVTEIKNDRVKAVFELDEKAGHDRESFVFSLMQRFMPHRMAAAGIVCRRSATVCTFIFQTA